MVQIISFWNHRANGFLASCSGPQPGGSGTRTCLARIMGAAAPAGAGTAKMKQPNSASAGRINGAYETRISERLGAEVSPAAEGFPGRARRLGCDSAAHKRLSTAPNVPLRSPPRRRGCVLGYGLAKVLISRLGGPWVPSDTSAFEMSICASQKAQARTRTIA